MAYDATHVICVLMLLPLWYALSGTEIAYAATRVLCGAVLRERMVLPAGRTWASESSGWTW
eukprot:2328539-Rhodomonas_salina.1